MNFSEFRSWFDIRFSEVLQEKINSFSSYSGREEVRTIISYVRLLGAQGKRFRPFLVYQASGHSENSVESHIQLFCAVELLHLFALIHDDIMDKGLTRHGVPCAHIVFGAEYGDHTGNTLAILLGDMVLAWAYECLSDYTRTYPEFQEQITTEFHTLVSEVTHGQILDVLSPVQSQWTEEMILEKMILKTARYSFVRPLRLGFIIAGNTSEDQEFAEMFGTALGVAFQLQDDLLDILPQAQTDKSSFADIMSSQQTVLSWYMMHSAQDTERDTFISMYGISALSDTQKYTLREVLVSSGAVTYVQSLIDTYMKKAQDAIIEHNEFTNCVWQDVIALVASRKK